MNAENQYIELFKRHRALIDEHSTPVMNAAREEAFANFCRLGFPNRKVEKYRYTDIGKLFEPDYGLNFRRVKTPVDPYRVFKCNVPDMHTSLFFIINDIYYTKTRTYFPLPEGVIAGGLAQLATTHPDLVRKYYNKIAAPSDPLTAFNTAFAQDGFLLYIPKGMQVEQPIQLINMLRSSVNALCNRRILVVIEDNACANLLICDDAIDPIESLTTQVIEVYVGHGASLHLYELEQTNTSNVRINNLYVHQEADSHVQLNSMTLQNGITRNDTEVSLLGRNARIEMYGMAITDRNEHVDNHTFIDHTVPECASRQFFKYVLDDTSTGCFAGKVRVCPGAQKTDSQQTNRNICLTREARMYAQPQLEIYADDVKCSHGATVGQLDESAMFYMQQRGIHRAEARLLLMLAFVNEIIDTVQLDALKTRLHHLIEKKFRGDDLSCKGCALNNKQ